MPSGSLDNPFISKEKKSTISLSRPPSLRFSKRLKSSISKDSPHTRISKSKSSSISSTSHDLGSSKLSHSDRVDTSPSSIASGSSLGAFSSGLSSAHTTPYYISKVESIASFNSEKKKTRIQLEETCCFCEEPLLNIFEGESVIELTCNHHAHFDCYSEMLSLNHTEISEVGETDLKTLQKTVFCPICGVNNTCDDDQITDEILRSRLLNISTSKSVKFQEQFFLDASTPATITQQSVTPMGAPVTGFITPRTPVDQIGMDSETFNFEFKSIPVISTRSSSDPPSPTTRPLFSGNSPMVSTFPPTPIIQETTVNTPTTSLFSSKDSLSGIRVDIMPEFSKIVLPNEGEIPEYYDLNCVVNIKSAEYELPPISMPEEAQTCEISKKASITEEVIYNFESKLQSSNELDIANLGELILFDFMETVKLTDKEYIMSQVYLFETIILILTNSGEEIIKIIDLKEHLSSVFENVENSQITLNLASLSLPEVVITSGNQLIQDKWLKILSRYLKKKNQSFSSGDYKSPVSSRWSTNGSVTSMYNRSQMDSIAKQVPMIQMSTNAWGLLSRKGSLIPNDVVKFSMLVSKGLDLPTDYLKRQISRPDSTPLTLIVAIPLVNNGALGLDDEEYTARIKSLVILILRSLYPEDKLGLVFVGNKKLDSDIGNYYGCISSSWDGWDQIIESIQCYTPEENDEVYSEDYDMWQDGLKYIQVLSAIGFDMETVKYSSQRIHEVIFINTETIKEDNKRPEDIEKPKEVSSFIIGQEKHLKSVSRIIKRLCQKYKSRFHSVLLADEYQYHPNELVDHYNRLIGECDSGTVQLNVKQTLAVDFDKLEEQMSNLVEQFHDVSVRQLITKLKIAKGVNLVDFEYQDSNAISQSDVTSIECNNIEIGYEKLLILKLRIDLNSIPVSSMKQGCKIDLLNNTTFVDNFSAPKTFDSDVSIRLSIENSDSLPSSTPLNFLIFNKENKTEDIKLSILPSLSATKKFPFIKREVQLLVLNSFRNSIFNQTDFGYSTKEKIKFTLNGVIIKIWEIVKAFKNSNASVVSKHQLEEWAEKFSDEITGVMEGYSMRNYQLSNYNTIAKYLEIV